MNSALRNFTTNMHISPSRQIKIDLGIKAATADLSAQNVWGKEAHSLITNTSANLTIEGWFTTLRYRLTKHFGIDSEFRDKLDKKHREISESVKGSINESINKSKNVIDTSKARLESIINTLDQGTGDPASKIVEIRDCLANTKKELHDIIKHEFYLKLLSTQDEGGTSKYVIYISHTGHSENYINIELKRTAAKEGEQSNIPPSLLPIHAMPGSSIEISPSLPPQVLHAYLNKMSTNFQKITEKDHPNPWRKPGVRDILVSYSKNNGTTTKYLTVLRLNCACSDEILSQFTKNDPTATSCKDYDYQEIAMHEGEDYDLVVKKGSESTVLFKQNKDAVNAIMEIIGGEPPTKPHDNSLILLSDIHRPPSFPPYV
ncbi:hypothetical protein FNU76_14430 [Chitinimonas arctica]|uniref:Uncharacterized protein n=1 Tax=Chitinimonas arctica TaxID=2594795 RepID=A0A516SH19_9NEIS|nr:hypothetical protein [Chitinimonas arctica]QDQ27457.1 hypothetical protein FNU76_14430 [Chitinimonas arctica]